MLKIKLPTIKVLYPYLHMFICYFFPYWLPEALAEHKRYVEGLVRVLSRKILDEA